MTRLMRICYVIACLFAITGIGYAGSISGTVTNGIGAGIPALRVHIYEWPPQDDDELESVTTDEQGDYITSNLPDANYMVAAFPGLTSLPYINEIYSEINDTVYSYIHATPVIVTASGASGIDFQLDPSGMIMGTVTDSITELPIAGIWVFADNYDDEELMFSDALTDEFGVYRMTGLPAGDYRIDTGGEDCGMNYICKFYNDVTDRDSAQRVPLIGTDTTPDIDFELVQGTSISGYVRSWNGSSYAALSDAEVEIEDYTTHSWVGRAETEGNGSYTLSGLAAGSYIVRAKADSYSQEYYPDSNDWSGAEEVEVTVAAPRTGINFDLDLGGQISGKIIDEDTREPITEDVWVNAGPVTGEPWGIGTSEVDSDGNYVVSGLPAGTYKVSVHATGYDQEMYEEEVDWMMASPVTVTVGQITSGINFTPKKEAGGKITGRVVMPDGNAVARAQVNAGSVENVKWKWDQTEPNGYFTLTGITPGQWRLRAQPPFGEAYINVSESDEMIITMPNGLDVNDIGTITLPAVNLVGRVMMPDGNTPASNSPVNIETLDWSFFTHVQTDQDGYFRKGGLDPNTYRIRVEIPCGKSGIVRPDPCLVTITDAVKNIGVITYATASKHIVGHVLREEEQGVANVQVNCWRRGAEGWANTMTDSSGSFNLDVTAGTWEVMIYPSPQQQQQGVDWVYMGYSEVVTFTEDAQQETKTVNFTVNSANSHITGCVIGPAGETLRQGAGWIDIKDDSGKGNGASIGEGGQFSISVRPGTYNVWVGVDQQTYPRWSSPRLNPVTVTDGNIVGLGDIRLVAKTSGIQGRVTRSSDGQPVSGISIHAWQREGGWADTTTDNQGNYNLSILAGTWDVSAEPPYTSEYISGQPPQTVVVGDSEIKEYINFELQQAGGSIALSLLDGEGALLTDIDSGWAYARAGQSSMNSTAGGPVSNGQATIKLPTGTYLVGVCLPPNTGYTLPGEQEVIVAGSQTLELTLFSNDAAIQGTFYTDAAKTHPAIGIQGEVFAMQKMGGVWQSTQIDPCTASYQLRVAEGEWNLGYWIRSSGYINNPPPDSMVEIISGQTKDYHFVLVSADATITGVVLKPDGSPLNHAWVWAHSEGDGSPGSRVDNGSQTMEPDGSFTINVPSGREYEVGSNAPSEWRYVQPDFNRVTPQLGETVTVTLRYKNSDASITGRVYYMNGDAETPCEWAWVNAWSDNGQHAGVGADEEGQFEMSVSRDTTWHLEAFYHPQGESMFYKSSRPVNVVVSGSSATAGIEVEQASRELPPAVSATFDPNVGWNSTLEDGTRIEIPAGAIPADTNVCISFTPIVDELQRTATDKPVGWGYAISISEQSTGNPITDNFNTNVLITFAYRDEDLAEEGLTEDDISPAYFSTTTNSWTKVESFTVDKDNNTVTVQVNHFSTWALTGGSIEGSDVETVEMTITKCSVKAGKLQEQDAFDASGTFAESLADFSGVSEIEVNIISLDDETPTLIYEESIEFDDSEIVNGKYNYKGASGAITSLKINFNKKTFAIKTKNINLTGLGCPLQSNVTIGGYMLSGQAEESIVNSKKKVPIRLMRTHEDTMRISSAKAKASTKEYSDSFTIKGELAVEAIDSTDLAVEEVVITWADQTFTIPIGSLVAKTGKSYKCSKITADEGGFVTAKIDLDKCTFNISVKNCSLDVTSGAIEFGLSFAEFDKSENLELP